MLLYSGNAHVSSEGKENQIAEAQDQTVEVTGYKRAMVKTMVKSGNVPQFGYCDEVRMDAVIRQEFDKIIIFYYFFYNQAT